MTFDYKKEYKEFYMPKGEPQMIQLPKMHFITVKGKGDPNRPGGEYQQGLELLYPVAYTLKMSYKTDYKIKGFFDYVVPPLEGLWWQPGIQGIDYSLKDSFEWIAMIRLPDFVKEVDFTWAIKEAGQKKKKDFSKVELMMYDEGLCVQCLHIGPYDNEPETLRKMNRFALEKGYTIDITPLRHHHEIYLSDPRKTAPEKLKTILRHPVKK